MPLTDHVAIVSLTSRVSTKSLMQAAAAVQKQVTRDFAPIWDINATVNPFEDLESVPSDYHPVILFGDPQELVGRLEFAIGAGRAAQLIDEFEREQLEGVHLNAFTRQTFSLVSASPLDAWTVTLSHEVLEMLVDPYGNRLVAGAHPGGDQERVRYLVEVCDPCQSRWYPVNGMPVSDFYTPRFFDPVRTDGVRYSFTGALKRPLDILKGGYVTWIDPRDSALYQLRGGETQPEMLADLGDLARSSAPLRTLVDTNSQTPRVSLDTLVPADSATAADQPLPAVLAASEGAALRIAEAVASLAEFQVLGRNR